uniref:Tyr recombinase domain-containing protein n=1 Tax=Amphimedon queenslandica TaxID=400682 RepID=A0A1X7V736_AMPQE
MYLKKLPPIATEKDYFYCKPSPVASEDKPWYYPVPVGKNTLGNMVKDMATEAGLSGKKTNHSLRVAGATSLYRAGVPERIIQERTGHRSLQSLRQYERTSVDQEMAVSRILSGEADSYNPKPEPISTCAVTEATCSTSIKIEEENPSPKASKQPMVQYNNCTVNVFGGGKAQASPAPYPQYLPPPSSLMDQWINEGYQDFADYTY